MLKSKFFILTILFLFLPILSNFFLEIDFLVYKKLELSLSFDQLNNYLNFQKKWKWASFAIMPLVLFIKIAIIASVLYVGIFFHSKDKVTFRQLFDTVVKAEFIFLGVGVLKIIWFYFFQTNYTLEDLQYFYPLSALNIVGYKGLDAWFIYPLQTLNLFELAYWFLLSYYVGKIASPTKNREKNKYPIDFGLKIVASSYGSSLLLWIVVVMFFTLNYN